MMIVTHSHSGSLTGTDRVMMGEGEIRMKGAGRGSIYSSHAEKGHSIHPDKELQLLFTLADAMR